MNKMLDAINICKIYIHAEIRSWLTLVYLRNLYSETCLIRQLSIPTFCFNRHMFINLNYAYPCRKKSEYSDTLLNLTFVE